MLLLIPLLALTPTDPPPVTQPPQSESQPQSLKIQVALIGFADDSILSALRLRLPTHAISRPAETAAPPDLYLRIERSDDTTAILKVITADGRAYDRRFAVELGHEVRAVATTAVNLLFAIEQGTVPPDQHGVEIPTTTTTPEPEQPVNPTPPPPPREPEPTPPSPDPPRKTHTLSLVLHGAGTLGLGPPQNALAAAGGGLGLDLRTPRGLAATFDLRAAGKQSPDLALARLRIGLGVGWIFRHRRLELPIIFIAAVEPWWPLQSGRAVPLQRTPLLSAHLRVAPGVRLELGRHALRVGPRLELGGGFVVDDGPRAVSLDAPDGTPRARLGGLELSLGLELALQLSLLR